jgi:hypothetical protein
MFLIKHIPNGGHFHLKWTYDPDRIVIVGEYLRIVGHDAGRRVLEIARAGEERIR